MKKSNVRVQTYFFNRELDTDGIALYCVHHIDSCLVSSHNYDFILGFVKRLEDSGHVVIYDESLKEV